MISRYGKSIVAFAYAVLAIVIPQVSGDHHLGPAETVNLAIAVVTAAGVYLIPLAPAAKWTKSAVGFLLAGLNVAATVILDGSLSGPDWVLIAASALGAIGITLAPAVSVLTASRTPGAPAVTTSTAVGFGADR